LQAATKAHEQQLLVAEKRLLRIEAARKKQEALEKRHIEKLVVISLILNHRVSQVLTCLLCKAARQAKEAQQSRVRQMHELFLDVLLTVPVLCSLDIQAKNEFLDRCELKTFTAGQVIVAQGEPPAEFHVILSGHCTVYQMPSSSERHPMKLDIFEQRPQGFSTVLLQNSATRLRSLGRGGENWVRALEGGVGGRGGGCGMRTGMSSGGGVRTDGVKTGGGDDWVGGRVRSCAVLEVKMKSRVVYFSSIVRVI
jgi:hypothetical protein